MLGIEQLYRLDQLPALRSSLHVGSVSSYDRTGGNDDGFSGKYSFVRKDDQGVVLADLQGPGVIYRLWTPTPTDEVMEFFFDGEAKPRIEVKFRDLFLGKHPAFPRPLVGAGAGGYYSYVPMPYAKSCVIRLRAAKAQFYQINFARYSPETVLQTFAAEPSADYLAKRARAESLWNRVGGDLTAFTTPPGAEIQRAMAVATVAAGATQTVFRADRGGRIVGLRVSPASALAGKARDLILRISFDGEGPAVLCPIGDFFGYAWGQPATRSLLIGTEEGTNYCYFPMPFDRSATIDLVSERSAPVEVRIEVAHTLVPRAKDEGKFYAFWRRENPTVIGEPYHFLEIEGRGHLVGVTLQAQGFESGKTLFFEGDDETWIDGETAIRGTGSEDFFNGGWYDVPDRWERRMSFPLSGCLAYAKHLGRTGGYRFFLGDAYAYRTALRETIEHAGEKNSIPTDYSSVAYFYSERYSPAAALPARAQRQVVDLAEIIFPAGWQLPISAWSFDRASLTRKKVKLGKEEVRTLSLAASGDDWFGPHFISPVCDLPVSGLYSIYIEVVKGPDQAIVQLFQSENPAGERLDLYAAAPVLSERLLLGKLRLEEGKNNLMFKLVGKNPESTGLGLDLVRLVCVRDP